MPVPPTEFYKEANLTENPFRSNPQESDPRMGIWVGYQREREQLWKFLVRTRADQIGNANFLMIYGDLGTGKSHALLWARHQILEAKKAEFNSVCYYIQTLRKDAGKITFAGSFREDIVGKSSLILDVLKYKQFLEECVVEYKRDLGLGPETHRDTVLEKFVTSPELYNYAREIVRCESDGDVRSLLIPKGLGDYQAMMTLTRLVNLFVLEVKLPKSARRFKQGAYLFVDELDLLATSTAKEARDVNELLRHLYDLCPNCFCMVLGFTATAAELNILFAPYVLSRVNKQIVMQLLDIDEAKQFVHDILDKARMDTTKNTGYVPFEEQAVQIIVSQIVSITPRKIINAMQQILEEVRLLDFDPSTGLVTAEFLEDNSVLQDVLGN